MQHQYCSKVKWSGRSTHTHRAEESQRKSIIYASTDFDMKIPVSLRIRLCPTSHKIVHVPISGELMRSTIIGLIAVLLTTTIQADDWPQFLGPHRDGVSGETGI